jgi:hypothetical protein
LSRHHPYLPPGPTCHEPCCAAEREAQEPAGATESSVPGASESEAKVWSVGIWTPYVKADPEPSAGSGVKELGGPGGTASSADTDGAQQDERLRALYRKAANTSLLAIDVSED